MSAGEYCNRDVVVVTKTEPLREAINLMRTHHIGDVVVVDNLEDPRIPLGILTDRDIVVEILGESLDLDAVNIGDVMSYDLVSIKEDTKLMDVVKIMRSKGVRRVPVVDTNGHLVGIITVDDILELIAEQLTDIVSLISLEQRKETKKTV